jgi:beta-glucosidase
MSAASIALALAACAGGDRADVGQIYPSGEATAHPGLWPKTRSPAALTDERTEAFVQDLLSRMSVEEKVGQTIQADINFIKPAELATYPLGSILAGGNSAPNNNERASPQEWVDLARTYREAAKTYWGERRAIPLIFGIDAVHGHNNVVGATIFPHNIGLGAARDPDLIRRIGEITAREVAASGADWTFGPTLAVPRDDRWGRSYEGYSENPEVVASYAGPMTLGLQGELVAGQTLKAGHIPGSAKHFLADGGTEGGRDQGDARISEREMVRIHNAGYVPAIESGVLTVMASFSSWNGVKHTANRTILTDVLKERMGFTGFVVSDWNAHGQIPGCTVTSCPEALNAGIDMYMAPDTWRGLFDNTVAQVKSGAIPMARLDDAVRRILRVKVKSGLFETTYPVAGRVEFLGAPEHRAVAREAVRKSLVLLKNNGVLPLKGAARVLVAGDGADNIGKQSGGWTLSWQGTGNANADFPNGSSIYGGIAAALSAQGGQAVLSPDGSFDVKPDAAVVVFGEEPYAETQGDQKTVTYRDGGRGDLEILRRLKAQGVPVVTVFLSGRPLWVNPEINASDAFVAAWLPGSEGVGVADVLVGDAQGRPRHDFTGTLSFSWPRTPDQTPLNVGQRKYDPLFAFGYGLSYAKPGDVGLLSEEGAVVETDPNILFAAGKLRDALRFTLRDSGGETSTLESAGRSPAGVLTLQATDAGQQENARTFNFSGAGDASALMIGQPQDLSRETNAQMAIAVRMRLDTPPTRPVYFALGCGDACLGRMDVTQLIQGPVGEWRTVEFRLNCLEAAGADMKRVDQPFTVQTDGKFAFTFTDVRVKSFEGETTCPG